MDLLTVQTSTSDHGGLPARPPANADVRYIAQPRAIRQTNDYWQYLENWREYEWTMVTQLGFERPFNKSTPPKGRRQYIDAFAYGQGHHWHPKHYSIDVAYPDSGAEAYLKDPHAAWCFLPPPVDFTEEFLDA